MDRQVAKQAAFLTMAPGGDVAAVDPGGRVRTGGDLRLSGRPCAPVAPVYGSRAGDGDVRGGGGGDGREGGDEYEGGGEDGAGDGREGGDEDGDGDGYE